LTRDLRWAVFSRWVLGVKTLELAEFSHYQDFR